MKRVRLTEAELAELSLVDYNNLFVGGDESIWNNDLSELVY